MKMRVLLVDLDFVAPSVALVAPTQDLPSLSTVLHHHQISAGVDSSFLHEFAPQFSGASKGFRVIAGLSRPERWQEVEPRLLQELLKDLAPFADLIVCDLHANSHKLLAVNAVARGMLTQADAVIALANANPIALARILREIHELRALRTNSESIHVVFNQLAVKTPQPPEVTAFVELTKLPAPMTIRDDHDTFEMLVARASTKSTLRKRSAYKTDIQALTDKVLGL
jgi:Flp pilus assembly CpaE family ATPase